METLLSACVHCDPSRVIGCHALVESGTNEQRVLFPNKTLQKANDASKQIMFGFVGMCVAVEQTVKTLNSLCTCL
jgi:hypothetical protein